MHCGSLTAVQVLDDAMNMIKGVFERRIMEEVKIDNMQYTLDLGWEREMEPLIQSLLSGRCRRNMGERIRERSCLLLLWTTKWH